MKLHDWALPLLLVTSCTGSIANRGQGDDMVQEPSAAGSPPRGGVAPTVPVGPTASTPPGSAPPTVPPPPPAASPTAAESAGPMPLRRLSRLEYDNTIRDLLGDASRPAVLFADEGVGSSGFREAGKVSDVEARRYADAAEAVAAAAVKDLRKLMGCDPVANEAACVAQFLPAFGKRAFRRPVSSTEVAELQAFYQAARMRHDVPGATGLLLQAMLQSPRFLYRWEAGDGAATREGTLVKLGAWELASRLSYFLWRSMPDEALFAAVESGKLKTADDVVAQARRMLADRKARETLGDFHLQWAKVDFREVDKDRTAYPLWASTLPALMTQESQRFVEAVFAKDGKLSTLLTAPVGYVNAALGKIYGVTATGSELRETPLDGAQRAGLFTLAGFLAAQGAEAGSHPIRRGKVIWETVVCGAIPPPPANIPPPQPAAPNLSTRERFAAHSKNECAAACHALFDPPGFAFENYDGIGQWRTTDGGKPVDATGTLALPLAGEKRFTNAVDMMKTLATSEDARRCLVTQWARYALGRHDTGDDAGSLARAHAAFAAADFDARELLIALVKSKTFMYRQPIAGEVF